MLLDKLGVSLSKPREALGKHLAKGLFFPKLRAGCLGQLLLEGYWGHIPSQMSGFRVVVDSSMLQSEELGAFLSVSPENKAILTDYVWMEAYKFDPVRSIMERLSVLKNHPEQVLVLKGTRTIAGLDARAPGLANRMIWPRASQEVAQTFKALNQARSGDLTVIAQILEHGRHAQEQMQRIDEGVPEILASFPEIQDSLFTKEELKQCRTQAPYSPDMVRKILNSADQIFEMLLRTHPSRPRAPTRNSRINMFLYRFALASTLYFLRWIKSGGPRLRNPQKVRNDFIDLNFATVGTYFNGLMTDDVRARNVYVELQVVLERLGARMPNHYLEGFIKQIGEGRRC